VFAEEVQEGGFANCMVCEDEESSQSDEIEIVHKEVYNLNPKEQVFVAVKFIQIGSQLKSVS
jgi:hypothetical protein